MTLTTPSRSLPATVHRTAWTLAVVVILAAGPAQAWSKPWPAADRSGWMTEFGAPEPDGMICALGEYQGALIIAGEFTILEDTPLWHIARWDGERFDPLERGLNGPVRALATYRGDLIAAGDFTAAGEVAVSCIARWDGTEWHPLGRGSDIPILTVAVVGDTLFAGGPFGAEFGTPARAVRAWDGVQWRDAGFDESVPVSEGYVHQLLAFDGRLVAWWDNDRLHPDYDDVPSGVFHLAGERIAGRWRQMPEEYPGEWFLDHFQPDALLVQDGRLYAVGELGYGHLLVEWDGRSWRQLASPGPYTTASLGFWRGQLLVSTDDRLHRWTGSNLELMTPLDLYPSTLHAWREDLWTAGRYALAPGSPQPALFRWDGTIWTHYGRREGLGLCGENEPFVASLAISGRAPAVYGRFDRAGGVACTDLIVRDGHGWQRRHTERRQRAAPGSAHSLWSHGPWLYFGIYSSFDGPFLMRSSSEQAEGVSGLGATPVVIHNWDGRLFIGGPFTRPAPSYIVERVPGDWHSPRGGLNGPVEALCTYRGVLVAGGSFTASIRETAPLRSIACWDGWRWFDLGGGLPDPVTALAPFRGGLAAACTLPGDSLDPGFDSARPARGAVFWFDGSAWQPLGAAFNGRVRDLEVFHGRLIAAGDFTLAPGRGAVAALEEGDWVAIGEGMNGPANALLAHDDTLWVGGRFTAAGSTISARLAGWIEPTVPLEDFLVELAGTPRSGSEATAADSAGPVLPPDSPRARVSFRLPDDPRFDRAFLRTSSTGFPADPEEGDPLRPGTDGSFDGGPGDRVSHEFQVAEGTTLYIAGFAADLDGQVSRPSRSILHVPDQTPPWFSANIRRLPSLGSGAIRFQIDALCPEPPPPPGPSARFGDEVTLLERPTGDPFAWFGVVARPPSAQGEAVLISVADSVGNVTTAISRWAAAPVFAQAGGRCTFDDATWVEYREDVVHDPAWLTIVGQPESAGFDLDRLGAWHIALNEEPRHPLLLFHRPSSRSTRSIDLSRLALAAPHGERLAGTFDSDIGVIWFWIDRNGDYRLVRNDTPTSSPADPHLLRLEGPFPNPSYRTITVRWEVAARQPVHFELFDVAGRRVARLFDGLSGPGPQTFTWSPSVDLPAGIYFGRVRTENSERSVRLVWRP